MYLDVIELRDFYDSPLGRMSRRLIRRRMRLLWPDVRGMRILGVGFATPFLAPFQAEAERTIVTMPASQGVLPWPAEGKGLVTLTEDVALPFPDRFFDRIILAHSLEQAEGSRHLMREMWRVLADGGRLMVMAPNRRGIWARLERTPFGAGRPYSSRQLCRLLRDNMFTPLRTDGALFVPPIPLRLMRAWARPMERLGARWFTNFSGVVLVEAAKQIYAAPRRREPVRQRRYLPIPEGMVLPGRRPGALNRRDPASGDTPETPARKHPKRQ